jgi:hypothetical protein
VLLQNNHRLERFVTTPQRNSGARLILFASADDPRLKRTHGCGFYKEQGWSPNFTMPTTSRIDAPEIADGKFTREIKVGQSTELRGIALGGDRGIQKVELSFDGERSWQETTIVEEGTKISWSTWSYEWRPGAPGEYVIAVRATDGTGAQQISEERSTVLQGATGLQRTRAPGLSSGGKPDNNCSGNVPWNDLNLAILYRPITDAGPGGRTELLAGPLPQSMQMNTVAFSKL